VPLNQHKDFVEVFLPKGESLKDKADFLKTIVPEKSIYQSGIEVTPVRAGIATL
jgi:hypothetical protein